MKAGSYISREFHTPYSDGSVEFGKTELKFPSNAGFTAVTINGTVKDPLRFAAKHPEAAVGTLILGAIGGGKFTHTTVIGSTSTGSYRSGGEFGVELQATLISTEDSVDLGGASGDSVSIGVGWGFGGNAAIHTGGDTDNDGYSEYGGALGWKLPYGASVDIRVEPKYLLDKAEGAGTKAVDDLKGAGTKAVDDLKKVVAENLNPLRWMH